MIPFGPRTARFCILTVFYQDAIAFHFRFYIFVATTIVFLLYFADAIAYSTFLWGLTGTVHLWKIPRPTPTGGVEKMEKEKTCLERYWNRFVNN